MALNGNNNSGGVNIVPFSTLDKRVQNVLREAVEARLNSYSPYSGFKVGACLEAEDGALFRGCNVENACYTVGTCAERCAFFKAISEGRRKFKAVAVVAHQEKWFTTPCGACRQLMREFGDLEVYVSKPDLAEVMVTSTERLLPQGFQMNEDYTF